MKTIAISAGDPAGVGPFVSVKAAIYGLRKGICLPVIFTSEYAIKSERVFRENKNLFKFVSHMEELSQIKGGKGRRIVKDKIIVVNVEDGEFKRGIPSVGAAKVAIESIVSAARFVASGGAMALVTAPVSKVWISRLREFKGHTEFLAELSGLEHDDVLMCFRCRGLVVGVVTRHIPVSKVSTALRFRNVFNSTLLLCGVVCLDFNVKRAKVGVCCLNPHGGEGGLMGHEEGKVIAPAVDAVRQAVCTLSWGRGVKIYGPLPADALFREAGRGKFDAVLAMYHDQAMIPVKMLSPFGSCGYTAGLPFVRTTPDHGTAYELARSKGAKIQWSGMKVALEIACLVGRKRNRLSTRLSEVVKLIKNQL